MIAETIVSPGKEAGNENFDFVKKYSTGVEDNWEKIYVAEIKPI